MAKKLFIEKNESGEIDDIEYLKYAVKNSETKFPCQAYEITDKKNRKWIAMIALTPGYCKQNNIKQTDHDSIFSECVSKLEHFCAGNIYVVETLGNSSPIKIGPESVSNETNFVQNTKSMIDYALSQKTGEVMVTAKTKKGELTVFFSDSGEAKLFERDMVKTYQNAKISFQKQSTIDEGR